VARIAKATARAWCRKLSFKVQIDQALTVSSCATDCPHQCTLISAQLSKHQHASGTASGTPSEGSRSVGSPFCQAAINTIDRLSEGTMRASWAETTTVLLPRSPRISDLVVRRPHGLLCSRPGFAAVTLTVFLVTAAFLMHEWHRLETNGSYIASMTVTRLRRAPWQDDRLAGTWQAGPELQAANPWHHSQKHQLLQQVPDRVMEPSSHVYCLQRPCPNNCSNIGNCLSDLGECQCPGGKSCSSTGAF
jgi:hypothetical protein